MKNTKIKNLLSSETSIKDTTVKGWIRTKRESSTFCFIELNDGSCLKNLQIILDNTLKNYSEINNLSTGASIGVVGDLIPSQGKGQKWEIMAKKFQIYGLADSKYPLQKKGHSLEYLREIAHLRPRSNLFGCVFRVRSRLSYAVHQFFQEKNFIYIHTPIITANDCEGAGELFKVTTFDLNNIPNKDARINYENDFFGKPTYLTVSGQLEGEIFATALSDIYTFGPTFRAENSNTARHASEFWMIEPEMAFCDLESNMQIAEEFIKYLVQDIRNNCKDDIELFAKFVDKKLLKRLDFTTEKDFKKISYEEAISILSASGKNFIYPVSFGVNLQTEHERYLAENHFKCPVIIYNYPKTIKPFYMRLNNDNKTVAAMDIIVPGIGEIIGGSQREERENVLRDNMKRLKLSEKEYWWYIDTRKYGTVPHSGFGLGFERMLMFITGLTNIRDVIAFARTPLNAEF